MSQKRDEINQILDDVNGRSGRRKFFEGDKLNPEFQSVKAELVALSQQAKLTDEDIEHFYGHLGELTAKVNSGKSLGSLEKNLAYDADIAELSTAKTKLEELKEAQDKVREGFNFGGQIQPFDLSGFEAAASATQRASDSAASLAANYRAAAEAAQQTAASQTTHQAFGGAITEHYAAGGSVRHVNRIKKYFADGGQAQGGDTVPAMLTPGEFVLNAASSAKFYSQLTAMNAGLQPTASGASVTNNVSVGGITIADSPNPQRTAREVMDVIRREMRRGTGKI